MQQEIKGFRLSPQQKQLWLSSRNDQSWYCAQNAILLEGDLDLGRLRRAVQLAVDRHEILRTTFHQQPGSRIPIQVIHESGGPGWRRMEINQANGGQSAPDVEELFRYDRDQLFDLEQGPLTRLTVVSLGPARHLLLIKLPSLCADHRTLANLFNEIVGAYRNGSKAVERDDDSTQYLQFSEWHHSLLESEEAEEGRAFWRRPQVDGPLPLPFEKPGSTPEQSAAGRIELEIADELVAQLRAAAAKDHSSLAVWLLSAWQLLLWRLTRQPEITVEYLFDGRRYDELQGALGLFATFIPLSCRFSPELTFQELLRRVDTIIQDAEVWQEFWTPGADGESASSGDGRISFEFIDRAEKSSAGGVSFSTYRQQVCLNRFGLKLSCSRCADRLTVELFFDRARFSTPDLRRLIAQYRRLLESTAGHAEATLESLELIDDAERERLVDEWNDTRREFPRQACLHQLFEAQAASTPDAAAAVCDRQHLSYRELDRRANRLARYLQKLGVGPESRVGLCVERSVEMVVGVLGVLKAGGAYVPLDLQLPRERLAFMIDDARLPVLLTTRDRQALLPAGDARIILLDSEWDEIARESDRQLSDRASNRADARNLAYLIYTSGSTGVPKGVMIEHRGLVNYLSWSTAAYRVAGAAGAPVHSPLAFDLTVTSLFIPLLTGQTAFLIPEPEGIEGLNSLLTGGQYFGLVKLTPSHLDLLSQLLPAENAAAQTGMLVVGGEALWSKSLDFWRRHAPRTRIVNEYGPTETVVGCCIYDLPAGEIEDGAVPIGRPIANTQLYVLEAGMQLAPTGAIGELFIGGEGLARGYLNQPGMTAERFLPAPYGSGGGARVYRTGDTVRYLSDGNLEYLGRTDQQVKIHGYRIELGEIEAALVKHEAIRECAVVAKESAAGDKQLIAYVVPASDRGVLFSDLIRFLAEQLPPYMVPTGFVSLDALPLTSNGKLDYRSLPSPEVSRAKLQEGYTAPSDAIEEVLAAVWSEVLGVDRIGVHDNFFALGGDSMRSIRVTALVKERGWNLSPQDIFRYQTIGQMAAHIRSAQDCYSPYRRTQPFELVSDEDRWKLPPEIEDAYPLGMVQAGMLYHTELTPDAPVYHNVCSYRVRARLEPDALRQAVQRVIERHPLLRTSFDLAGYGEPLQLVHRTAYLEVPVVDIRHLSNDEQEKLLAELVDSEWKTLFNLKTPPLLRFYIHQRTDQTFQFTSTDNHALIDGWSLTSTFSEIFSVYFALLETGTLPHQPPPQVSYRDFIAMEREALASEECRRYWVDKLEGSEPLRLPRPPQRMSMTRQPGGKRVRMHPVPISVETGEKLRHLARALAVPLKSLLLAAHLRVLSLISGQADFLAGVGVNGRPEELDGDEVRGLFLNVLPFRFQLPRGSWKDLVRGTFEAEMEMFPHRRYPLAAMQQRFGRQTLLETDFEYLHFHSVEKLLRQNEIEFLENRDISETNFVMVAIFHASPVTSQLTLRLNYHTTELSAEQIETYGGYYSRALSALADESDRKLDSLHLLSPEERSQLLVEWNATETAFPGEKLIHELFETQVDRTPDAIALSYEEQDLTYRELNARADRLARHLRGLGVGPDVRVAICLERSIELVVALLATLKAGGAYVPLDPGYPPERLAYLFDDCAAAVWLTHDAAESVLAGHSQPGRVLNLDRDARHWAANSQINPAELDHPRADPDREARRLAYVIYTSGSTGLPKGAMNEHRSVVNRLVWMQHAYRLGAHDAVLQKTPFSFDVSVWEFFWPILYGARLVMARPDGHRDPAYLARTIQERNITTMHFVPSMLQAFLECPDAPACRNLARVICSGEALPASSVQDFNERLPGTELHNLYGPTEAAVDVTAWNCRHQTIGQGVPIGRPIANTSIYILDVQNQPTPVGVVGELYIGGVQVGRGYLNRPELTAERFLPDPFSPEPGTRIYKTGDLSRWLPDGNIEYQGRNDFQVKIRGFRIELGEIETALTRAANVAQAVVVAREDQPGEKRLVGYVVAAPGQNVNGQELQRQLRHHLPEYMVPAAIVVLESLPLTANGKMNRKALPAPEYTPKPWRAPRTPHEVTLCSLFAELLGVAQVGLDDNFFELGGNSLASVRLVHRARKLGLTIKPRQIFQAPTVEALAAALTRNEEEIITRDLAAEAVLDPAIIAPTGPSAENRIHDEAANVLLTGASGFLGAFLLSELFSRTRATIHCLVRAGDAENGRTRIRNRLESFGLWDGSLNSRLIPVPGDLSKPLLGLSRERFEEMAEVIDAIYHNGAMVNAVYPYEVLKPANVLGTQEALRLASVRRLKPVHFISTLSVLAPVSDPGQGREISERQLLDNWRNLSNGYAQSKWVAEKIVEIAGSRGIPTVIYRPGFISGSMRTGAVNLDDSLSRFILACLQAGSVPDLDSEINLMPVDFVSHAIIALSMRQYLFGRTLNLANGSSTRLSEIVDCLLSMDLPLRKTTFDEWRSQCAAGGALSPLLAHYSERADRNRTARHTASPRFKINYQETLNLLESEGLRCPRVTPELLRSYISYLLAHQGNRAIKNDRS